MKTLRLLLLACALLLWSHSAGADPILDWTFDTIPSGGDVGTAPPGTLVSWGYTIHNLSDTLWLAPNVFNQDPLQHGTPTPTFDFPIVAPGDTVTGPLLDFLWDIGAPNGFVNAGLFYLTAEFWTDDQGSFFAAADDRSTPFTATVENTAVPEPGTLMLLGFGLSASVVARRRRVKNANEIS